jgi:hypothetical protein
VRFLYKFQNLLTDNFGYLHAKNKDKNLTLRNIIKYSVCFMLTALLPLMVKSQCTVGTLINPSTVIKHSKSPSRSGQTFTSCEDGQIDSISVEVTEDLPDEPFVAGLYELYIASGPIVSGVSIPGPPHQIITINTLGVHKIAVDPPFSVVDGTVYEFELVHQLSGNWLCLVADDDYYPDGVCTLGSSPHKDFDLNFEVIIGPIPPTVPTVGEMGADYIRT